MKFTNNASSGYLDFSKKIKEWYSKYFGGKTRVPAPGWTAVPVNNHVLPGPGTGHHVNCGGGNIGCPRNCSDKTSSHKILIENKITWHKNFLPISTKECSHCYLRRYQEGSFFG